MNKRKWLLIALAAICVSILAYGTTAFFTAEGQADNVITTGNVAIELIEKGENDEPFEDQTGIMPGAEVAKKVSVENTGANECWVRVKVKKAIQLAEGTTGDPDTSLVELDFDTENWIDGGDGWYYYNEKLAPDAETPKLFTQAKFDESMGNMYQNSTATVTVSAQAVQCANNGDTVTEAKGWPEEAAETPETPEETTPAPDIIA